jgi:hypothetical protein
MSVALTFEEAFDGHRRGELEPGVYLLDDGDEDGFAYWVQPDGDDPWPSPFRRHVLDYDGNTEKLRALGGDDAALAYRQAEYDGDATLSDGENPASARHIAEALLEALRGYCASDGSLQVNRQLRRAARRKSKSRRRRPRNPRAPDRPRDPSPGGAA